MKKVAWGFLMGALVVNAVYFKGITELLKSFRKDGFGTGRRYSGGADD